MSILPTVVTQLAPNSSRVNAYYKGATGSWILIALPPNSLEKPSIMVPNREDQQVRNQIVGTQTTLLTPLSTGSLTTYEYASRPDVGTLFEAVTGTGIGGTITPTNNQANRLVDSALRALNFAVLTQSTIPGVPSTWEQWVAVVFDPDPSPKEADSGNTRAFKMTVYGDPVAVVYLAPGQLTP